MAVLNSLPAGYDWRPARLSDAAAIHQLLLDVEAVDRRGVVDTLDERARDFADAGLNLATDTLLGFDTDSSLVGLAWVTTPPQVEDESRVFLWGEVHPRYRGRGLGSFLLHWMEQRGEQILAALPGSQPRLLRASCPDFLRDRVALYEKHGFYAARYSDHMRRKLSQPIPGAVFPADVRLVGWRPEMAGLVLDALNDAFYDHWGFFPISPETWRLRYLDHPHFRPDMSFLVLAEDENPVVGFCVNLVNTEENQSTGVSQAWIQEVGVRRRWRKRGIAGALVCASLQAFRANGFDYAGLAVDADNLTGAQRIYQRLGFELLYSKIYFARRLQSAFLLDADAA